MFKRDNEQPVKVSFEEKKNNKEKRSLRERLSSIPVRRRVEAVLLAVVTIMASLSIDWSSLVARAAKDEAYIGSDQSISQVFYPNPENATTTLSKAKISVKISKAAKEVDYTWKVYQNLGDDKNPESGVEVGNGGSGTIAFSDGGFVESEIDLSSSNVVLRSNETAAVVFTLKSKDGYEIAYKTFDTSGSHYVKSNGKWNPSDSGTCMIYTSTAGGSLTDVTISGVPQRLAMTAGQSYTFSNISWSPKYQRTLSLESSNQTLIPQPAYPTFTVADATTIGNGGEAKITVNGDGVARTENASVTVKVVSFELNGEGEDNSVFTYNGSEFDASDLYTAKCGSDDAIDASENFTTTFSGASDTPVDAGEYTMRVEGQKGSEYEGLVYTKDFIIKPKELTSDMFSNAKITVKNGTITKITGAKFGTNTLVNNSHFNASIKEAIAGGDKVTYTITITGINNFSGSIEKTAEEASELKFGSVVDHISFKNSEGRYDGAAKTPEIVFYGKDGAPIEDVFEKGENYTIKYNGNKRDSDAEVTNAESITDAGVYTAVVYGEGKYKGSEMNVSGTYTLTPINLTNTNPLVTLKQSSFESSESLVIDPEIDSVVYTTSTGEKWRLSEGRDYVLKSGPYSITTGKHEVDILDGHGNYEGTAVAEYTVFPSLLNTTTVALDDTTDGYMVAESAGGWDYVWTHNKSYTYKGEEIEPKFTVNINNDLLSVGSGTNPITKGDGVNCTDVTTEGNKAYYILTLPAKYASKRIKVEFEITAKALPQDALTFNHTIVKDYVYGNPVELKAGSEYSVIDEESGLEEGVDYTISYSDNRNAGEATITATGIGNYSGTSSKKFTIRPVDIEKVTIEIADQTLDTSGTVITDMSKVKITLKDKNGVSHTPFTSEDFTLSNYRNNTNAWVSSSDGEQPVVTVTGKRNLSGSKDVNFKILKWSLEGLTWRLNEKPSVSGVLGSSSSTVDLTSAYGYSLDFDPNNRAPKYISLYSRNGSRLEGGYSCITSSVQPGKNTITIVGTGNYEGAEYIFTYDVKKLDINDCEFSQTESEDGSLPKFTLTYDGEELEENTDYEVVEVKAEKDKATDRYPVGDGYTVTFKGLDAYDGTRTDTFHVGKPFDKKHVFITMYGPTGTTTTVNGENRLTYFGNNDPYFILTSDKTDGSKIEDPEYAGGAHKPNTGDYNITFEPSESDERHKVGTTVKVTFTAKKDNGVWYNPGNEGITYYYKVMPGVGANVSDYPNLQSYLSIYTEYSGATPGKDNKESFPTTVTDNLIRFSDFKFPYTTEEKDPEIYICYNPKIESGACATECSPGGVPSAPTDANIYAEPEKVKFNDSSLFTVSKGLISANDEVKKIIMTPVRTGWLGASNNPPKIEVNYSFTAAKLSDATITFTPSNEYTYSGKAAAIDYKVTIGNTGSTVLKAGTDYDYVVQGYYAIPDSGATKSAIDNAITSPSTIEDGTLASFGNSLGTTPPTNAGNYALVIKEGNGGNYKGYNIAKFSIKSAGFTAAFAKSDFSVLYGSGKLAPEAGDLIVTGVNGESLSYDGENGYTIEVETGSNSKPTNAAVVNIKGKGNYKDASKQLTYPVVADISKTKPDFSVTNLSLDEHTGSGNCLGLTLENDGEHPYIYGTNTKFDLSTLTLSEKNGSAKIEASDLTTTVTAVGNYRGDSLETVGMKKITVSGKTGSPVKGDRTYYVEVFADISTADITLEANGTLVSGGVIPYTGQAITVNPILKFRGTVLDRNSYSVTNLEGRSFTAVGKHMMTLKGNHDTAGDEKYYIGTPTINFSIAYDLQNGVEIVYAKTENSKTTYVPLSGMSFGYTGNPIGTTIEEKIVVRLKNNKDVILNKGQDQDYTLEFANDTLPGGNTAKATINHTSINSINEQTVYFSIGGNKLTENNCDITFTDTDPEKLVYDGTAKEPAVTVTYTDEKNQSRVLSKDTDYKITYSRNIDVPASDSEKPTVTITGINGRYEGTVTKTFDITAKEIKNEDVDFPDVSFGGRDSSGNLLPGNATITVTVDGRTLVAETDYDIKYGDGTKTTAEEYFTKDPGASDHSYTITVTGKGNYYTDPNGIQKQATQLSGTLNNNQNIIIDPSQAMTSVYNGKKVTFGGTGPKIMNGKSTLREGTDYSIDIPEIINVGTYTITIKALSTGDYYDNGSSKTFTYTVTTRSVEENSGEFSLTLYDPVTGNSANSFAWDNTQIKPKVRLADTRITEHDPSVGDIWTDVDSLKQSIMMDSFTVAYGENRFAGKDTGSVTLNASGNYKGSITRTFSIGTDISNATLSYDKTSAEYDGTPKKQDITVRYNNNTLEAGVAYESPITYTYTDSKGNVQETTSPTAVGSYVPVIKGKTDGGYYGELKGSPFRIIAQNKTGNIKIKFSGVGGGEVDAADYVCHYNTKKQTPSISVYDTSGDTAVALTENVDYTVSYGNNTNAGSGYVYVALKGNYTGTAQEIFTIRPYDISNATLEFIEGENGIIKNVPEASFPYSPLFKLIGTDDDGKNFEISYADSRQKQDLSIPDSSKVKKPGKGSLAVSGTGNNLYGTTNAYDYEVYGRLSEKNVIVTPPINTGVKKDPEVKVVFAGETLVLDTDYSLRIVPFDQTVSGGGNVIVEGLGYFTGSVYTKYGEASDVSSLTLRGFSQQYIYSGVFAGPQESAIYAVDKDGNTVISADKLECTFTSDKDNAACITANATVTITTKATLEDGTVQDGPKATYKIVPRNINSCDIMRLENDIYTGKALKPPVAVSFRRKEYTFGSTGGIAEEKVLDVITLKEGTDYSLSYKNNVYPGTADITVTGKGNYTGTRLFHFVINVISMGSVNARRTSDGIVVSWAARPYVAGYRVLYDTDRLTGVSTTGTTVTLKDAMPTRVGVQPYILGSGKTPIYGAAKYIDVS